ncbi:hypothetical protein [Flagellimonas pacifica]|uniref:Peptidase S74 domain-containing protein n=1 Tax=Flagellimonas pacifica TaxID=1247520 RepID=A0A285MRB2_9FLAO|nr:hypothetical protein [Allomuricauda parva]SNY99678.1 hypothetical protein SAMN06265377_1489 [Allomuricauda parva]
MKSITILLCLFSLLGGYSQTTGNPNTGDAYLLFGPNTSWSQYLKVGGNGRGTTNASVVTTNGNLHLDSKNGGYSTYINHYSQGNTFLNPQGGNVGIGTSNAGAKLDVNGNITFLTGAEKMYWGSKHTGGTDHRNYLAPRLADNSGWDWSQEFGYHFYNRSWYVESNLGIGTSNPGSFKLAVKGKIRAEEIKVETGWADYVFNADYDLPTLEEVEKYIQEKGHLMNIPSAEEVEENGIQLGEMNKLLLEKIEELTLYTIEQQKEIDQLKTENTKMLKLENELQEMRKLISKMIKEKN